MEQQYLTLLQGVWEYEQKSLYFACFLLGVALVLLFLVIAIRFKKETKPNRVMMCSIAVLLCTGFGLMLFFGSRNHTMLQADLEQKAFVTYDGTFTHDEYQRDSFYRRVTIVLDDGTEETLYYPDYGNQYQLHDQSEMIPAGQFTGTLVYTKNSRIIVDWNIRK